MKNAFKDRHNWPAGLLLLTIFGIWTLAVAQQGNQSIPGSATSGAAAISGNVNVLYVSPACPQGAITGNCAYVHGNGAFDCGQSWTTNNTTITLSANATRRFTAADVGTIAFGTQYQCGAWTTGNIPLLIAQTTIQSVTDSTHAVIAGTGPSNNCTVGGEGNCVFVWGDIDDTTNLQTAFTTATTASSTVGCGTLGLPSSIIFVSKPIINTSSNCSAANYAGTTFFNFSVFGQSMGQSIIVPLPGFDATTCPTLGNGGAFFSGSAGNQGVQYQNFSINGFGSTPINVSGSGCAAISDGANGLMSSVGVSQWGPNTTNLYGIGAGAIDGSPVVLVNVASVNGGTNNCFFGAWVYAYTPDCSGGTSASLILANNVGGLYTFGGVFESNTQGVAVVANNSANMTWYSTGDTVKIPHAGQPLVACTASGAKIYATNDNFIASGTSSIGLSISAGCTVYLKNTVVQSPGTTATGISNSGTLYDLGGNTVTGTTAYSGTGTISNFASEPSIAGRCLLASQVSPEPCVNASNGKVAVPASTATYTINTTAVQSGSIITITPTTDNTGITGAPTCTLPATTTLPQISASSAGTNFTITFTSPGATIVCFDWSIR